MAPIMHIILGLLTFITFTMIFGALFQLAFIRRFEDSYDFPSLKKLQGRRGLSHLQLSGGISVWENDPDAQALRIGYECEYLMAMAKPRLEISTVVDTKTGKPIKSEFRTSSGMFLNEGERMYPIIQAIKNRISVYSQVPVENVELIQKHRYKKNKFYKSHTDYFRDTHNVKYGGQRVATMLMYLSDNVEGGETYFPQAGMGECNCGGKLVKGVCVKPVRGDAVLFWSMGLDGQTDPNSLHGGCDVLSGEKWSATKWMRQNRWP